MFICVSVELCFSEFYFLYPDISYTAPLVKLTLLG